MIGFELSPLAELDLEEIIDFIALDDPAAARTVASEFLAAFHRLVEFPQAGHIRDDLAPGRSLRFWKVHSYLVIYNPAVRPLGIVRVLSGHRDIETVLALSDPTP